MATKGVPDSGEISQPDGNDEGTYISTYSSLGAPECFICHVNNTLWIKYLRRFSLSEFTYTGLVTIQSF